jgi:hypothetical protein
MDFFISVLVAGFGGGIVRGLVGFLKKESSYSYKNPSFNIPYFFLMAFLSGIVGLLAAIAVKQSAISISGLTSVSPAIAFIIGYAGGDFLDGLYKILLKRADK